MVCWLKSVYVFHAVQRNKYTKVYIIYVYIYDIKPIIQSYPRWKLINKINKDTSMKVDKINFFSGYNDSIRSDDDASDDTTDGIFWGLFTICFDLRIKHIKGNAHRLGSNVCYSKS